MKKKILFISPLPPPYYGSALSSEMCLKILNKDKRFDVRNIKINYSETMSDMGKINLSKIKGFFRVLGNIDEEIKTFKPDLVYFVPATSGLGLIRDYLFSKAAKKAKKIIFHIRSRITPSKNKKLFMNMFSHSRIIVLGETLLSDVNEFVNGESIIVLPNAIENELGDKDFKKIIKNRVKRNSFRIVFLSNMEESKGWFKLLEACKIIKGEGLDFKCSFVGEFPSTTEQHKFEKYVKANNLDKNISYLGKRTGKHKNKILEESDLMVFPTEYKLETFGRVIIEAMMFGLPVIANGIASIPSIIKNGKSGFVLKKNTKEEIAQKITLLYNNRKKLVSMGKSGRNIFLDKFEAKKYAYKFKKILLKN